MDTKRIRQKLLDLAIHGKLVSQDPTDEPASELLKRIHEGKLAMVERGELKPKDAGEDVFVFKGEDGLYYEQVEGKSAVLIDRQLQDLPTGWCWTRMNNIAYVAAGKTPSKADFVDEGIPYFKMYNLRNQQIDFEYSPQYVKPETHYGKLARSRIHPGDLIMNIVGPPLGKMAIVPEDYPEANTNQAAVVIRPYSADLPAIWLFYYLSEMSEIDSITTRGSAGQVNISLTQSKSMFIAVPPAAEQKRIIAALNDYIGLANELEKCESELDDLVKKAKSKVLDLAIRGKLVTQNPEDEPASELLARIHEEKLAMVERGELKPKDVKNDSVIYVGDDGRHYEQVGNKHAVCIEDQIPFELPGGWAWSRLGSFSNYGETSSVSPDDIKQDDWVLDLEDIEKGTGKVLARITKSQRPFTSTKRPFAKGQLLYSKLRPYLNKVLLANEPGFCTAEILPVDLYGQISPAYMRHCMMSDYFLSYANQCSYGVKMPRLGANDGRKALIPIPPLEEQKRIVEKINQLIEALESVGA